MIREYTALRVHEACMQTRTRACMIFELAVSVVSAYCGETVAISERMFGNESY